MDLAVQETLCFWADHGNDCRASVGHQMIRMHKCRNRNNERTFKSSPSVSPLRSCHPTSTQAAFSSIISGRATKMQRSSRDIEHIATGFVVFWPTQGCHVHRVFGRELKNQLGHLHHLPELEMQSMSCMLKTRKFSVGLSLIWDLMEENLRYFTKSLWRRDEGQKLASMGPEEFFRSGIAYARRSWSVGEHNLDCLL
jgi:hypothetical protein